jgi:hypothetical protein
MALLQVASLSTACDDHATNNCERAWNWRPGKSGTLMNKLCSYISAIHQLSSPVAIVRRESTQERELEQGYAISKTVSTYWFDNGAVLEQTVERDEFPSEQACSECWISYQVLANTCRETFWLNYQRA